MIEQDWDYDGWEKEEASDFDDYLDGLGPAESESDSDGSIAYWSILVVERLVEVVDLARGDGLSSAF